MLISETINSAWRIRTKYDAMEAGVLGDREGLLKRVTTLPYYWAVNVMPKWSYLGC